MTARLWITLLHCIIAPLVFADSPSKMELGLLRPAVGIYNISRSGQRVANFQLEYDFPYSLWLFKPFFGLNYNSDIDFYGYTGVGIEIFFSRSLYLFPTFSFGYYRYGGHGLDLGYPMEFREGLELGWIFKNDWRLSFAFYHMSNSSMGRSNPGAETLFLSFSVPIALSRPE